MADTDTEIDTEAEATGPPEPPEVADATHDADPHLLAPLVERLSAEAAEAGRTAIAVLSVLLRDGEMAEDLTIGRFHDANAVVALTTDRLIVASDRPHKAEAFEFPLAEGLEVTGWQDGDQATIAVVDPSDSATVDEIIDRPSAQRLAAGVDAALAADR